MARSVKSRIEAFVTSPLDEGKRMASCCGFFIPELMLGGGGGVWGGRWVRAYGGS